MGILLAIRRIIPAGLVLVATLSLACTSIAVAQDKEFQPVVGQEGKDVIWVPTPDKTVEKMLALANVGPADVVVDLGSGDGRIVVGAAKLGARATGVDMNPDMVKLSERRAEREKVSERAKFFVKDIFETDLKPASVVTMYLLPQLNLRLRPTILDLKPGTRVVSHAFDMAEWEPDGYDTTTGNSVRLWIVPAKAGGAWNWRIGERAFTVEVDQKFQKITLAVKAPAGRFSVRDATLRGDEIKLALVEETAGASVRHEFSGKVNGGSIDGAVKSGNSPQPVKWSATRKPAA